MSGNVHKNSSNRDKWCHSHLKTMPFSFTWTIDNFSLRKEDVGKPLESSSFTVGDNQQQSEWHVKLYPKGIEEKFKSDLSLYLVFWCAGVDQTIKIQVSILDNKMENTNIKSFKNTINSGKTFGWPRFIGLQTLRSDSNRLLPEDILTISVEGFVVGDDNFNTCMNDTLHFKVPECDVTLCIGDEKIQVHKAVLAAQSTVFSAIFYDTVGKVNDCVKITDIEPKVMHEILRFIYTAKAPNLERMPGDLLAAADNYNLGKLKVICAATLMNTLSIHNAADILILADRHSEQVLKHRTISFINSHGEYVIDKPNYKVIVDFYPHLLDEIFRASMATRNSKKRLRFRSNSW